MEYLHIQIIKYLLNPSKSEDDSPLILLYNPDAEEDGDWEGEDDEQDREDGEDDSTESTGSITSIITTQSVSHWYCLNEKYLAIISSSQETLVDD